jgi:acyl carrier protein
LNIQYRKGGATMDDTAQRCIAIIAKAKNIPTENITLDTSFEELNIDSLDKINISFEVEEAFNIEIPDDSLGSLKTVGDVVRGVDQLVAAKSPGVAAKS